jgi:hypothetical protein
VINRYPILSAIPVDEDSTAPYFARLPSITLEEAVTFLSRKTPLLENEPDAELDKILQDQHNTAFKSRYGELPFWRLIILANPSPSMTETSFTACFIFHHALGDGTSGLLFHRHFLSALSTNPCPLPNTTISFLDKAIFPNLETLHPHPTHPSTPAPNLSNLWSGALISHPLKSNFRSLVIPASTTAAFILACRRRSTTITATLPALIVSALSSLLPSKYENFEATIPVSLRRFLPSPFTNTEEIGVFIDAFPQFYTRQSFSWDEARRSKSLIDSYLKTGGQKINVAKMKNIPDMRKMFLDRLGSERGSSFDVSNLGGLAVEERDGWKMGRVVFSRSAFVAGSAFSTGLVTGPDGCLVLGFVWQEGVVERGLMMDVIDTVRKEIEGTAHE